MAHARTIPIGTAVVATLLLALTANLPATAATSDEPLGFAAVTAPFVANPASTVRVDTQEGDPDRFDELRKKEGGVVTHPNPDDPNLTVTTWADEGLQLTTSEPPSTDGSASVAGEWACLVDIPQMKLVVGGFQWGATMTCEGDHTPSWITGRVEDTCAEDWCFAWQVKAGPYRSSYNRDFLATKGLSYITPCDTNGQRKLSVLVEQYRDGARITTWDAPDQKLACHSY